MKKNALISFFIILNLLNFCCAKQTKQISFSKDGDGYLWFKNSKIQLKIDNTMGIKVFYNNGNELLSITKDKSISPEIPPSHFLIINGKEVSNFEIKSSKLKNINTTFGKGKRLSLKGKETDNRIEKELIIELYENYPDIALTKASYKNNGDNEIVIDKAYSNYFIVDESLVNPPDKIRGFWTFQGAAYLWGQDFAFKLPERFSRENYFGMNNSTTGGGIPLIDIWCDKCGIAVGHIESKPAPVYMPVTEKEDKSVEIAVYDKPEKSIKSKESYNTINTMLIVHSLDFFDALKQYGNIMKNILPPFKEPPELAYKNEWCTWGFRKDFTIEKIYKMIPRLKELEISSVILDDGWFPYYGDWWPLESKFPKGEEDVKQFVKRLHDEGFKVWLWWSPFSAVKEGDMPKMHPDWLIMNEDGNIHRSYDLCPAYPPVIEHHKKLVEKFVRDWDFDGFKLDFTRTNSAPPCYNPKHNHKSPWESYEQVSEVYKIIYETATSIKPDFLIEYCPCGIPPSIYQLPWFHLPVTSDPKIDQITNRVKMYKALYTPYTPVIEECTAVLAGPIYEIIIGTGGVPGTFATVLDEYHKKWLKIYREHMLSKGEYLNLYDIAFDFPEGHVIKKDSSFYYAFYTTPLLGSTKDRIWRFGTEFDSQLKEKPKETKLEIGKFEGKIHLRGLDESKNYSVIDYANNKNLGTIKGSEPYLSVNFDAYLLLKVTPE